MLDRQSLLFMNGLAVAALGLAMLLPAIADLLTRAPDARVFLGSAGVTLACGGFFIAASGGFGQKFNRKTGFVMTVSVWITMSLFAALPFAFSELDLSYVDGVFEAVSGLTTTGATTITGLDNAPKGILLWRALLNWMGGIGIVGMAIVLLPFLQVGGMQLFRTDAAERSDKVLPARQTALAILVVYLALNTACALAYWFGGMSAFDAIAQAMSTISTGGFSTHDASFGYFKSPGLLATATLFMFLGALPFVLFIKLARGEVDAIWRDGQVLAFALLTLLASTALAILVARTGEPWPRAVGNAVFNTVSLLSSTGFASTDYALWGPFAGMVFLILIFHGGCTGSTAGGIKTMRFEILLRLTSLQIRRLLDPHAVVPTRYAGRPIAPDVTSSVSTFVFLYVLTVIGVAIGLGFTGLDVVTSLSGAAAAVGNVRAGLGEVVGPAGSFAPLSDSAKMMLAAGMLLGRFELFAALVLATRTFWRS